MFSENWSESDSSRRTMACRFSGSAARISRQMLSACAGSFSSRYLSARSSAAGMAARDNVLSSNCIGLALLVRLTTKHPEQPFQWVVEFIHHTFLQWDDGVVRNGNTFRSDVGAALRDIA